VAADGSRETVLKVEAQMLTTARRAISAALLLKGMAGFSLAVLALFGVVVPHFGVEVTNLNGSAAATAGAILGAVIALRG
jgi:hypothetical protein